MKIGMRRCSVMLLAVAGVIAIEVIAQLKGTPGLSMSASYAIPCLAIAYIGGDAWAKRGTPDGTA